jgi:hypothetical protein
MKRLLPILFLAILMASCEKDELILDVPNPNAMVLDYAQPIPEFENAYLIKGQTMVTFHPDENAYYGGYALARLYTNNCWNIGDDLTAKVEHTDSTQYIQYIEEKIEQ